MKMPKAHYELLKSSFKAVVEYIGLAQVKKSAEGKTETWVAWLLFREADKQLQYADSHPFFANNRWTRIYPHNAEYKTYGDGSLNDDHIKTAILRICKELGVF